MTTNKKIKILDISIFGRIMSYASAYKNLFIFSGVFSILLAIVSALRPRLIGIGIDDYVRNKNEEGFLSFTLLIFAFLFVEVLLQLSFIYLANLLGQNVIKDIRTKLFKHVLSFNMAYFNNSSVGKMVTRVVSDVETIAQFFSQGLFMIVNDILKMFFIAAIMLYTNWKLALIAFIVLPILIYATKVFQKSIKTAFQEVRTQVANLNSFVQERVTGMKIVQLFNREEIEYQKFQIINNKHKAAHIKTVWHFSIFYPIAEVLSSIAIGLLVWYGGKELITHGNVTQGEIISFIMMTEMLFRPLRQIADKFTTLQMGMVAGDRIFDVMDTQSHIDTEGDYAPEKILGTIDFNNVFFSYIKDEPILKGISFHVKQGETVAIVGATGAGKSTIINLINRFYDIDSGTILVDNIPLKDYDLNFLRNEIAIVLQDVFLFSDSIENNISLQKEEITLEEIKEAAHQIGISDFINTLPNGFEYNVKERGIMLSSGQRQLIAFLRAYVSNPSILILDEATSSIDSHSEQMIQFAIDKITKDRTSIVIAHRLATIKNADKIIVLDQGNVVEQGTHNELLKITDGFYKNLHDKQFANQQIA
ncbi:ABC transporter ATP-binding protein [Wenyingzhuangia sp. 2_MG-2023]|uniref:ABC transporter ATP-binding protein n=1 Tax=Wenyingzhuangia sp. 2_MG-2023 TaxID=3062639 RepID=UPI0026E38D4F|nr:ABC transporter ATP-binding protein [Wenyingzhuangia sp. 2_MG-2023]MDO6737880.1 ABC transporter ATP-binding protein [Wenyingzhuangia sp. 2_MG-2023]MDO6802165.1 ABC transporter ATP-binding protein [Wenyingzhuangia sp. 1_MG-2023]